MLESISGALVIMLMRIVDVSLGTFRMIMVVQAKKYIAGIIGFFEVLMWIFAMRYIVNNMDEIINLIGYAAGFSIGNMLGITLEEKLALGYVQLNIISKNFSKQIAEMMRKSQYGVTLLPAQGNSGEVNLLVTIIRRKDVRIVMTMIEEIDKDSFITLQHSRPFRGYIHGARK